MSEYLIQRYLSPDANLTNAEFARFQAKAKRLLIDAEAAGELTEESLAQCRAAEVERGNRQQELLRNSYQMDEDDFIKVLGALLSQVQISLSAHWLRILFQATDPDRRAGAAAQDDLIGMVDRGVVDLVRNWRANYQVLRCAQNAGYEWVRVNPNYRCQCRANAVHEVHRTEDMRQAFETGGPPQLIYPSPNLPCLGEESFSVCAVSLHPQKHARLRIDPEFERQLKARAMSRRTIEGDPEQGSG